MSLINKKILYSLFFFAILSSPSSAQRKPRLVVNITVSGLRYDYLLKFGGMNNDGIRRLIAQGAVFENSILDYMTTGTPSGVATIATGTTPSMHGIIGNRWYDYTTLEERALCYDKKMTTVGADDYDAQVSPTHTLIATSIGDCIKDLSPTSKVISIAVEPTTAVIAGGFLADGVYWVSPRNGAMVTSSYYASTLPDWVMDFNARKLADAYCGVRWQTSRATDKYYNILRSKIKTEGGGLDISSKKYDYEELCTTPAVNSLIKDFAIRTIIAENLGRDESTDYLSIVFEGPDYCAARYGSSSMELEDVIYRLDDELGTLLSSLEYTVGLENLLVVFSSAHGTSDPLVQSSRLPRGRFSSQQFQILINSFLGAQLTKRMTPAQMDNISGDTRWVLGFLNGQLYLNRRRILEAGFSIAEVQDMVAQFAIQFEGVADAITSSSMQKGQFNTGVLGRAQRSYFPRRSGDVVLNLLPGWIFDAQKISDSGSPYVYDTHTPMIFWGGGVKSIRVTQSTTLSDIAPTIAYQVGVTQPNAATGKQITDIFK